MKLHALPTLCTTLLLTACGGNLQDQLPDRRPDYRQSNVSRQLEVPPDLTSTTLDDQLTVPDMTPSAVASYKAYSQDNVVRNQRGFIEVLPQLYGVQVIEHAGALPYISVSADASTTWAAVKKYWENNGIRLKTQEPAIGLMETDWLENLSDLPSTGFSGLLNSIIRLTHDTGTRDRYRISFSREADGKTAVMLIYSQAKEKAVRDRNSKDPQGFRWQTSDNDNPELQLEMTRRVALFVSGELRRQQGLAEQHNSSTANAAAGRAQLTTAGGKPALAIHGEYAQAWRVLGIGLDKASFALEKQDYSSGTYQVQYQPQSAEKQETGGFWSRLWGSKKKEVTTDNAPRYLIRLSDQGAQSIAVVQTLEGRPASDKEARALLETVQSAL
ncbi:MAG: outer membrane protein assembly factor BamC [Cardiobacteriaceae bacterium]|nr:outer membrane protein assembly factor BamC [Cardiobacteriaceae bacterium]